MGLKGLLNITLQMSQSQFFPPKAADFICYHLTGLKKKKKPVRESRVDRNAPLLSEESGQTNLRQRQLK